MEWCDARTSAGEWLPTLPALSFLQPAQSRRLLAQVQAWPFSVSFPDLRSSLVPVWLRTVGDPELPFKHPWAWASRFGLN